jgi:hypothetical protein
MIFLDTGAFLARYLERDERHEAALRGFDELAAARIPAVTSCHVLDETISLLGRWAGHVFAAERGRSILASASLETLRPGPDQELAALRHFEKFADQAVSFTDCLSFVLMEERGIRDVFGFDRDFRLVGFRLWPEDSR